MKLVNLILCIIVICSMAAADEGGVRDLWFHQVPRIEKAPVIDGKRDDACWKGLPALTNFGRDRFSLKSKHPILPMRMKLGWDDTYLYCLWWIGSPTGKYAVDYEEMKARQEAKMHETAMWWNPPSLEFRVDGNRDRLGETSIQMNMVGQKQAMHKIATGWSTEYVEGWDVWADYKYASGYDKSGWWIELKVALKDLGAEAEAGTVMGAQFRYFHTGAYFAWTPGGYSPAAYGDLLLVKNQLPMEKALEKIMPDYRSITLRMPQPEGVVVVKEGKSRLVPYKQTVLSEIQSIKQRRDQLARRLKDAEGLDAAKVLASVDEALRKIDEDIAAVEEFSASDMKRLREPIEEVTYSLREAEATLAIREMMKR